MARIIRRPRRVALLGALSVLAAALVIMFPAASAEDGSQTLMDVVLQELDSGCTNTTSDTNRTSFEDFAPITVGATTHNSVTLNGLGDLKNDRAFVFWRKSGSSTPYFDMVAGKSECTFSGLEPLTTYVISVIRVQTIDTTIKHKEQKITVTTMSGPPSPVNVDDCSTPGAIGSPAQGFQLVLTDNTSASYCVTLDADPGGEATVRLELEGGQVSWSKVQFSTNGAADKSDDPPTLTFDSSNWQTPQVVTVHGVPDKWGKGQTYQLTHTASGSASGTTLQVIVVDQRTFLSAQYRCYNNICDQGVSERESVLTGLLITEAISTTCADDDYAAYQIRMSGLRPLVHNLDYITVNPINGQQMPRNFSRVVDGQSVKLKQPLHFQYQAPGDTTWSDIPEGGFRVLREHWGSEHWPTLVDKANSSGWYGVRVCAPLETNINSPATVEIYIWLDPTQFGRPRHIYGLASIGVIDNGME